MDNNVKIVVPYGNQKQAEKFAEAWGVTWGTDYMVFTYDRHKQGCAMTKNEGIKTAVAQGADTIVVLDDDCFPTKEHPTLPDLTASHLEALEPQQVKMFKEVTFPLSRGTPYLNQNKNMTLPVACSMGFWSEIGDYCAARQLAFEGQDMEFKHEPIFQQYFPLCGMNIAFHPEQWLPWCLFIDVNRYDDIWMGWLWQREAYRKNHCFALNGPTIRHSRQSDVWKNLKIEAEYAKQNDTLWREIATAEYETYDDLRGLLPV